MPPGADAALTAAFTESMARLASGVAVLTARQADGAPCGLLVSSVCSYSVAPPSVLVAVAESARACPALAVGAAFGIHLLSGADTPAAELFARRGADKFAGTPWSWDGPVPRLTEVRSYLRCVSTAVFHHGDHAVVVGEVMRCVGDTEDRDPLVYYRRRFGWRLAAPDGQDSAVGTAATGAAGTGAAGGTEPGDGGVVTPPRHRSVTDIGDVRSRRAHALPGRRVGPP
ncbi:flavin reductase family protein [Peterkaempfera bronchialis]|uniref:Flavin reductase n=1 Tax=Peterkaempfera bronchialis TaxID=2126346 RepID=A0A345SXK4_9ACTN|nr:flavin reductase family protein [Peterkaempfera bronchialis]AXI78459.1 flavin reductase [Peterkaempfera bronchialis]